MKKKFLYILTFLFAVVILAYRICAAEVTVDKSTTLQTAITKLGGESGTIVVSEDVTVSGEVKVPAQSDDIRGDFGSNRRSNVRTFQEH